MNGLSRMAGAGFTALLMATAALGQGRVNTADGGRTLPLPTSREVEQGGAAIHLPRDLKVPAEWVPLLNRAYEQYWDEGNHRPDAGFVLFARNPSKDTAKLWLLRMESKAKNLEQLFAFVRQAQAELVQGGLMEDRFAMVTGAPKVGSLPSLPQSTPAPAPAPPMIAATENDLKAVEFFFLYSPTCPHCMHLAETLTSFPNVRPLQATEGPIKDWPGLPKSDRATPETLSAYLQGGGVPVLVIYHRASNKMLRLTGSRSAQDIMLAAGTLVNSAGKGFLGPLAPSYFGGDK